MKNNDEGTDKLLMLEKSIKGMIELHRLVIELKELESHHQKTIEILEAKERKYKAFLENIPLKLFIKDRNSRYVYCNEKYAQDLQIHPDEIVGKRDNDFFQEDLAEKYIADDRRVIENGKLESIEDKYVIGGQEFIIRMVKSPIRDEKGNSIGLLGIFWDITEQKRNEKLAEKRRADLEELLSERTAELEKTSERLQRESYKRKRLDDRLSQLEEEGLTIFENTGTAMTIVNQDSMLVLEINQEFERLFGIPKEEVEEKKRLTEFVTADDLEKLKGQYLATKTKTGPKRKSEKYSFADKGKNIKNISALMALIPGTNKVVTSLSNISERIQLETDLQKSRERHRWLVENAEIGIGVIQDGMFRFINPKLAEIFGYSEEEITSRAVSEFIHLEDRELFGLLISRLTNAGVPQFFSFKIVRGDGTVRWLENKMSSIYWEGKPAKLNILTDISARKRAEDELLRSIEPLRTVVEATEKILSIKKQDSPIDQ